MMKRRLFALVVAMILCSLLAVPAGAKDSGLSVIPRHIYARGDNDTYSAVIMTDDSLWIFGHGRYANGLDHDMVYDEPVKIMENVRSVSVCRRSTVFAVLTNDNTLWHVEINNFVWNGRNNEPTAPVPSAPEKIRENVLSYSEYFDSFITTDHELRRFNGAEEELIATDVISAAGLSHAVYGSGYAIVHSDGTLWISGVNYYGDGKEKHEEREYSNSFFQVMDDVLSVSGNRDSIAVIKKDNSLWMWGENKHGELGNGSTERSLIPVKVLDDVAAVDWHGQIWGALRTDGSLWMWGKSAVFQGETGEGAYIDGMRVGKLVDQLTPVKVLDDVVEFSCGASLTLAVKSDGSLWGWGSARNLTSNVGEFIYGGYGVYQILPVQLFDGVKTPDAKLVNRQSVGVSAKGAAVEWTDAKPFIDANSRTMVPLRAVGDALGLTVGWDGEAREASFTDGTKTIYFPIGSSIAHDGEGNTKVMDTAAVIVNDRTYAPVRVLAEFFGYTVDWDGETRTVIIK